jgi:hypothetical protein
LLCSRALDETERAAKHIAQCAVVLHPPRNVAFDPIQIGQGRETRHEPCRQWRAAWNALLYPAPRLFEKAPVVDPREKSVAKRPPDQFARKPRQTQPKLANTITAAASRIGTKVGF